MLLPPVIPVQCPHRYCLNTPSLVQGSGGTWWRSSPAGSPLTCISTAHLGRFLTRPRAATTPAAPSVAQVGGPLTHGPHRLLPLTLNVPLRSQSSLSTGTHPPGHPRSCDLPLHHPSDEERTHHPDAHLHVRLPGYCSAAGQWF